MAGLIDIQKLFSESLPDTALADRAEGERRAANIGVLGAAQARNAPATERRLRMGVGGMFGLDMRNEAEKAQDALKKMGTPTTKEGHKAYANILDKVSPGAGVQYMMSVAEQERDLMRAKASSTSAEAQMTNAITTAEFAERDMAAKEAQVKAEEGALLLAGTTQEDLVKWRQKITEQNEIDNKLNQDKLKLDKRIADIQASDLDSRSKAAIRDATEESRTHRRLASEVKNLANEYIRLEPMAGSAGVIVDKFKKLSGNTDEQTRVRTKFREITNKLTMANLPPGVASDKDIELARSGFPDETWAAEDIVSYMKGMAKIEALTSEENEARALYMVENDGIDAGFEAEWRDKVKSEGFAEEMATRHGLVWRPRKTAEGEIAPPVSEAEAARRAAEQAAAAAEMDRRAREQGVADVSAFINTLNGSVTGSR